MRAGAHFRMTDFFSKWLWIGQEASGPLFHYIGLVGWLGWRQLENFFDTSLGRTF